MNSTSIENKNGVSILIDEEDLGLLTKHNDGYWCFTVTNTGYAQIKHRKSLGGNSQKALLHRLIMDVQLGLQVEHVNRDGLDNRRENLRICTLDENNRNAAVHGVSRFRGVYKKRGKWQASIWSDGKNIYLGRFDTEEDAAQAYDVAAKLQGCEVRFLNFPDEDTNA